MMYAVIPALRAAPELSARYEPLLTAREYDYELQPLSTTRAHRGHADVREAGRLGHPGEQQHHLHHHRPRGDGSYRLVGHKWFASAPMSDFLVTLAQADGSLSCFLVPWVMPDGAR